MKIIFCCLNLLFFLLSISICQAQKSDGFEIHGVIKGIGTSKILLGNKPNGYNNAFKIKYIDSCESRNDSFYFKGKVAYPDFYSIEVEGIKGWSHFVLDNSEIFIQGSKDSIAKSSVFGSKENDEYLYFTNYVYVPLINRQNYFWGLFDSAQAKNDSTTMSVSQDSIRQSWKEIYDATFQYAKRHPNNFISLYKLNSNYNQANKDSTKKYFSLLSKKLQDHPLGKSLHYNLFEMPTVFQIGKPIPTFSTLDTSGKITANTNFKGKYILIDFWASWCGPCIAEFPQLKELYNKYKSKGFEIVGLSIDTERNNWLNAVKEHNIPWATFSDLKRDAGEAFKFFNIRSIPQLYLIDSTGKLLYKNIAIENLDKIVSDVFNNK